MQEFYTRQRASCPAGAPALWLLADTQLEGSISEAAYLRFPGFAATKLWPRHTPVPAKEDIQHDGQAPGSSWRARIATARHPFMPQAPALLLGPSGKPDKAGTD